MAVVAAAGMGRPVDVAVRSGVIVIGLVFHALQGEVDLSESLQAYEVVPLVGQSTEAQPVCQRKMGPRLRGGDGFGREGAALSHLRSGTTQ